MLSYFLETNFNSFTTYTITEPIYYEISDSYSNTIMQCTGMYIDSTGSNIAIGISKLGSTPYATSVLFVKTSVTSSFTLTTTNFYMADTNDLLFITRVSFKSLY